MGPGGTGGARIAEALTPAAGGEGSGRRKPYPDATDSSAVDDSATLDKRPIIMAAAVFLALFLFMYVFVMPHLCRVSYTNAPFFC